MLVLPECRVSVRIAGFEASFRSAIAAGQLTPAREQCFPGTAVMQRYAMGSENRALQP
jgi:hypothetical protein